MYSFLQLTTIKSKCKIYSEKGLNMPIDTLNPIN